MRENGVDIPDPEIGEGGGIRIRIEEGQEPDPDTMEAAQEACHPILERAFGDREPPSPEQIEEMRERTLAFAQCMRDHGLDWPDPEFGDGGMISMRSAPMVDADAAEVQAASEECSDGEFGTGGGFRVGPGPGGE